MNINIIQDRIDNLPFYVPTKVIITFSDKMKYVDTAETVHDIWSVIHMAYQPYRTIIKIDIIQYDKKTNKNYSTTIKSFDKYRKHIRHRKAILKTRADRQKAFKNWKKERNNL